MIQVFVFGDSVAYGVGAEKAGWADLLKLHLQKEMYADSGIGEKYELYNFGKPGAGTDFVLKTHGDLLRYYRRDNKTVGIICIGGKDTKAKDEPVNFVSTIEEYEAATRHLLDTLAATFDELIVMPTLIAVDEAKVNPKLSPFTGGKSFFTNARITQFNQVLQKCCAERSIPYVLVDATPEEWIRDYLYSDGLHPNQAGQQRIFELVLPLVQRALS